MVGDVQSQEFLLGYSPDGQFEIIARPDKNFFQKNFFFLQFLVLYEILIGLMYRVKIYFFFCEKSLIILFLFFSERAGEGLSPEISPTAAAASTFTSCPAPPFSATAASAAPAAAAAAAPYPAADLDTRQRRDVCSGEWFHYGEKRIHREDFRYDR